VIVNDKIRVGATKRGDFSSFSLFFKSPGAGVTDSPSSITSATVIPLLTATPATSTGEIIRSHVQ